MANYWAIAIGINQYQCFQPLMYAQRDAQALWNYWVNEGGFASEHCQLLTDISPAVEDHSSAPSRDNIEQAIATLCRKLQPEDFFWCFFSGYGVRFEGQDYLMPEEGDPTQVPATGIPIESIFAYFETAATNNILFVVDINRSGSIIDGEGVGQEIITLANQHHVPTLLSCPPEQFSHETLALRHGLFTTALLEGLRFHGCTTVSQLAEYVGDRLPELSEHHWRPQQNAVAIIPAIQQHQLILPTRVLAAVGGGSVESQAGETGTLLLPPQPGFIGSNHFNPVTDNGHLDLGNGYKPNGKEVTPPIVSPPPPGDGPFSTGDDLFWQRWRPWILGITALLALAVLVQNRSALNNQSTTDFTTDPTTDPTNLIPNVVQPANPGTSPDGTGQPPNPPNPSIPGSLTGDTTDTTSAGDPLAPSPTNAIQPDAAVVALLEQARGAWRSQQYDKASQLLDQIPPNQRTQDYVQLLQRTNQGLLSQANIAISRSRALTANNQASDFNAAIQIARRIQSGQPYYQDAQRSMDRWSTVILDLARSRAIQPNRGSSQIAAQNYGVAIKAARLVPADRPELYTAAQRYIAQWSQTILNMAQTRADEGRFDVAIRTAQQIPQNTPVYDAAQRAIAQWKRF